MISPLLAMKKEKEGFARGCFFIFEVTGFYRFLETQTLHNFCQNSQNNPPKKKYIYIYIYIAVIPSFNNQW